jgi:hypothetical protein
MITQIYHQEKWIITFEKEKEAIGAGDAVWRDLPRAVFPYHNALRPHLITVTMYRNSDTTHVTVTGRVVLKSGELGSGNFRNASVKPGEHPWIDELIQKARDRNGLTPEKTGVPW